MEDSIHHHQIQCIYYSIFNIMGDAVDFGDLNYHGYVHGNCSNAHGGL